MAFRLWTKYGRKSGVMFQKNKESILFLVKAVASKRDAAVKRTTKHDLSEHAITGSWGRLTALFFVLTGIAVVTISCSQSTQVFQEKISLRMAEVMPAEHPSAQASQYFADLVRERGEGRIEIEISYGEELGDAEAILEQTGYGGIAFARVNSLDVVEEVISLESAFRRYAYENPDSMMNWISTHQEVMDDKFGEKNLKPLVWYYPDYRCFYNATEKINDIDDFRGLKIKTAETNLMRSSMSMLTATAVSVDNADMYRSMKAGYINAGEASFSEFVLSDYYDLVPYVTVTNYIACPDMIVASKACMESLSEEDQKLISSCAADTYGYQKEKMKAFQTAYIRKAEKEKDLFLESDNFSMQLKMVLTKDEQYDESE